MPKRSRNGRTTVRVTIGTETVNWCRAHNIHYRSSDIGMCPHCAGETFLCQPHEPESVYTRAEFAPEDEEIQPTREDIRRWALANGFQVKPTGNISKAVTDAYADAVGRYNAAIEPHGTARGQGA